MKQLHFVLFLDTVISGERCDNGKRIGGIAGHYSSFFFRGCGFTFEDVNIDLEDFDDNSRENVSLIVLILVNIV